MSSYSQDPKELTNKTIIIGAIANVFLAVIKIIIGIVGNSHALVADGVHSFSDLVTDIVVYIAAKFGRQEADQEHPYGHRRIETLAVSIISCTLILVALGIIYDSMISLFVEEKPVPNYLVLVVSIFSIFVNEWLYKYTAKNARLLKLDLLMANAWHHRSDAASSVVVSLGVLGAILGFQYLDSIAAVVVGLMIIKMAIHLGWFSIKELIDTSIKKELVENISKCILGVEGVVSLHELRGRSMAGDVILDVHIIVAPDITVSEGHYIGQQVGLAVSNKFIEVVDITVHIDPEDDEFTKKSAELKGRSEVLLDLQKYSDRLPLYDKIHKINLHYIDGKIIMDIYFIHSELDQASVPEEIAKIYSENLSEFIYIRKTNVYIG